ncbi:hypothetical protein [Lonepinella sp. BR2271]|uniref:hypothetical protein n=1 Tax=Lonepinella sp. BR2271 TaxID=3434550 RepID=UPI003F6DB7A5
MINKKQQNLLELISEPRLTYYEKYLNCKTGAEKLSAYFAYQELSSYFLPIIQLIEISMRNALDRELIQLYGPDWYLFIPQSDTSKKLVRQATSTLPQNASRNDVISRLTLGFWVYMLDADYRNTSLDCYIWSPDIQSNVFPYAYSPLNPKLKMSVKAIFDNFQRVLDLRNRLFHHEPIWKAHHCNSHQKAINNILKNYTFLKNVLKWLSQENYDLSSDTFQDKYLKRACRIKNLEKRMSKLMAYFDEDSTPSNTE